MASFNFKSIFKKINKKNNSLNNQESDFLNNFGLAEFGSALDMLAAAELTTTNKLKKGYLNHAIDEFRHAQLFFNHAKNLMNKSNNNSANVSGIAEIGERIRYLNFIGEKPIYSELNELDFINFVMISEAAAEKYFTKLSNNKNFNSATRDLFSLIAKEEGHHVIYAKNELEKRRKNGVKGIYRSYLYIKWFRFKTDLLSNTRKFWTKFGDLILTLIFFIFIPINKIFFKKNYKFNTYDPRSMI